MKLNLDPQTLGALLQALKGAQVNLNTGSGTQNNYHGVTIVQNNAALPKDEPKKFEWTYECDRCHFTSHRRSDFVGLGGYGNRSYRCHHCESNPSLSIEEQREQEWERTRREAIDQQQITAPVEDPSELIVVPPSRTKSYFDEMITHFTDDDFAEMQRRREEHVEEEYRRIQRHE
jgi:transposase-like protein